MIFIFNNFFPINFFLLILKLEIQVELIIKRRRMIIKKINLGGLVIKQIAL